MSNDSPIGQGYGTGGIIGKVFYDNYASTIERKITNCYVTSTIQGSDNVAGIIGYADTASKLDKDKTII